MVQVSASRLETPPRTRVRVLSGIVLVAGLALGAAMAASSTTELQSIVTRIDAGDFKGAEAAIAQGLADTATPSGTRTALEFQRERMRRIRLDFPLREADVRAKVKDAIPDLRDDEFRAWYGCSDS